MLTDRLNFYMDFLQDILNDIDLTDLWSTLSTKTALAVYVIVLLVSVLFLTVCVLVSAHSSPRVVSVVGAGVEAEEDQPPKNETKRQRKKREKAEKKAAKKAAKEARKEEKRRRKRGYAEESEVLPEEQNAPTAEGASAAEAGEDTIPEGDRTGDTPRFEELTRIDRRMADYHTPSFNDYIGLEELCTRFRNYAAYQLRLYYSIDDIRRFIASLGVSPIIIMQGMSGTGKTSLASAFGHFVEHDSTIIPIQPMWKERSDMIGYFNEFTERFNEMTLLKNLYEANYNREIYVTVLDEMNIARVEYYFADFLSLLELPDKKDRRLEVVSDTWENDPKLLNKGKLTLPDNMWYIGTANNDDSTFAISDKVYDRAMIMNLDKKAEPFVAPPTQSVALSCDHLQKLFKSAMGEYSLTRRCQRKLQLLDEYMVEHFHVTFGNRIMKQIKQYVPIYIACGGNELDALDDIFSKKILRKLESQNPVYIRNAADGLVSCLDELFGEDHMPMCKDYLKRLRNNA